MGGVKLEEKSGGGGGGDEVEHCWEGIVVS